MRRADERWALADVTAPPTSRSRSTSTSGRGPGFGVLFRAERRRPTAGCPATRSTSTRCTRAVATSCASGAPTASSGTRSRTSPRRPRRDARAPRRCGVTVDDDRLVAVGERRRRCSRSTSLQAGVRSTAAATARPATGSASRPGRRPISSSTNSASPSTDRRDSTRRDRASRCSQASNGRALPARTESTATLRRVEVEEYARIAAAEDDHWWYRNTRALVADLLAPWLTARTADPRRRAAGPAATGRGSRSTARSSASTCRPTRSPSSAPVDRRRVPVRASLDGAPVPRRELRRRRRHHRALHDRRRSTQRCASWRACLAPGGALLLVRARLRVAPARARRDRARTASLPTRRARRPRAGQRTHACSARRTPTRSWRHRRRCSVASSESDARRPRPELRPPTESDVERRSLDRAFAPLARAERRLLAHHDVPFGTSVIVVATAG